jgi:hypothetical protein
LRGTTRGVMRLVRPAAVKDNDVADMDEFVLLLGSCCWATSWCRWSSDKDKDDDDDSGVTAAGDPGPSKPSPGPKENRSAMSSYSSSSSIMTGDGESSMVALACLRAAGCGHWLVTARCFFPNRRILRTRIGQTNSSVNEYDRQPRQRQCAPFDGAMEWRWLLW